MKYKKIKDSKTENYKHLYRELEVKADEIPEIDVTGEPYLYIKTKHGTIQVDATYDYLELTIYNPTGNEVTISKAKRVKLTVSDF